jgi:hypothetical protein
LRRVAPQTGLKVRWRSRADAGGEGLPYFFST